MIYHNGVVEVVKEKLLEGCLTILVRGFCFIARDARFYPEFEALCHFWPVIVTTANINTILNSRVVGVYGIVCRAHKVLLEGLGNQDQLPIV